MTIARFIALAGAAALAGCTATAADSRNDAEDRLRNVPAAKATGPAQNCIRLAEVSSSDVLNDWTIDFDRGPGREIYRAELDRRCPGLSSADAFTYKTQLNELCTTEIIYPLYQTPGFQRGAGCGISRFIPMELAP